LIGDVITDEHGNRCVHEKLDYFFFQKIPIRKAMGIPHKGYATMANSSTPLRIAPAVGDSLPNAVMNAIKNTAIHIPMNTATANKPRFQFALMSSRRFRMRLSLQ
jgi:hypothetical protein